MALGLAEGHGGIVIAGRTEDGLLLGACVRCAVVLDDAEQANAHIADSKLRGRVATGDALRAMWSQDGHRIIEDG